MMDETTYNSIMDNWRYRVDECAELARHSVPGSDEHRRLTALEAGYRAALNAALEVMQRRRSDTR